MPQPPQAQIQAGDLLPSKDELAAIELARGKTRLQAAEASGLSERTIYSRLQDPVFVDRVLRLRSGFVDSAVAILSSSAVQAAETLVALLGKDHPPTVRLGAARAILSDLIDLSLHAGIEERIAELERRAERGGQGSSRS
jgi:hypothetical protein